MSEGYDESLDVRKTIELSKPVTILTSESGLGKTWSLARALVSAKAETLVAWVTAHRNGKQPDELAAAEFSNGLQISAPVSLDQISIERRKAFGEEEINWGLVCVDDVNGDEANHLLRLDWEQWGIRLVMSCTSNVARKIADFDFLNRIEVNEFSIPQLREYLSLRGKDWVNTNDDVRRFIRKPILARLYCDIEPDNPNWRPENEYDLLESFWKKIDDRDLGAVRQIADWVFENDAHPVPAEIASDLNISTDTLSRLSLSLIHI